MVNSISRRHEDISYGVKPRGKVGAGASNIVAKQAVFEEFGGQ